MSGTIYGSTMRQSGTIYGLIMKLHGKCHGLAILTMKLRFFYIKSWNICTYYVYFKSKKELDYNSFVDPNIHSDLRIYRISYFLLDIFFFYYGRRYSQYTYTISIIGKNSISSVYMAYQSLLSIGIVNKKVNL